MKWETAITNLSFVMVACTALTSFTSHADQNIRCDEGSYFSGGTVPDNTGMGCVVRTASGEIIKHGKWIEWYLNGQKLSEGFYDYGVRIGKWIWWYPTGKLMRIGEYKNERQTDLQMKILGAGIQQAFTKK